MQGVTCVSGTTSQPERRWGTYLVTHESPGEISDISFSRQLALRCAADSKRNFTTWRRAPFATKSFE